MIQMVRRNLSGMKVLINVLMITSFALAGDTNLHRCFEAAQCWYDHAECLDTDGDGDLDMCRCTDGYSWAQTDKACLKDQQEKVERSTVSALQNFTTTDQNYVTTIRHDVITSDSGIPSTTMETRLLSEVSTSARIQQDRMSTVNDSLTTTPIKEEVTTVGDKTTSADERLAFNPDETSKKHLSSIGLPTDNDVTALTSTSLVASTYEDRFSIVTTTPTPHAITTATSKSNTTALSSSQLKDVTTTTSADLCGIGEHYVNDLCAPCPIGSWGSDGITCRPCDSGTTTFKRGTTSHDGCIQVPVIVSMRPDYGPLAGGTNITVEFRHLGSFNFDDVIVSDLPCFNVTRSISGTAIHCLTSQSDRIMSGPVTTNAFYAATNFTMFTLTSPVNFTYLPDPVITHIDNFNTILSGGLTVRIMGYHLMSVHSPRLRITRIYRGTTRLFTSICQVTSDTEFRCVTPDMSEGMSRPRQRRGGNFDGAGFDAFKDYNIHLTKVRETNPSLSTDYLYDLFAKIRWRRDATPPTYNDEDMQFHMGFDLDGVTTYKNMTNEYGQLPVYPDPVYSPFESDNLVRRFNPQEEVFLHLKGQNLNFATDIEEVDVTVGMAVCNVTFIATNQLTCRPPEIQPDPEPSGHGPGRTPRVTVYVGSQLTYVVGYLHYVDGAGPLSQTLMWVLIAVGGAVPLLILFFTCLICVIVNKKKVKEGGIGPSHSIRSSGNIYFSPDGQDNSGISSRVTSLTTMTSASSTVSGRSGRNMSSSVSPPDTPIIHSDGLFDLNTPPYRVLIDNDVKNMDVMLELEPSLKLTVQECLLNPDRLTLGDVIGQGQFGKVYKGELKDDISDVIKMVAVKTAQTASCSLRDVTAFLEEAVVMKDFNHNNVLSLLGVILRCSQPYVILPYMEHGDLKTYIKHPDRRLTVRELLRISCQVACGMQYLADQKFVHRDLATRNCMLNKEMEVKIADFGLSRDIYKCDYYRLEDKHRPLPVKWMAIESLTTGLFSMKTDVWSFGVLLWELLTRGCTPYPDVDCFRIKSYLQAGRRLSQPDHAPSQIYSLMLSCWDVDPDRRPDFIQLYASLMETIDTNGEDGARYHCIVDIQ